MNYSQSILIQGALEAILPLLGYFSWGWSFSFILLFYAIDALLVLVLLGFKLRKRIAFIGKSEQKTGWMGYFIVAILFISSIVCIAFTVIHHTPHLILMEEILAFLTKKELGIPQGIVLIPLLTLTGIMLYRTQFLMQARYRSQDVRTLIRPLRNQAFLLIAGAGIYAALMSFIPIPEVVVVMVTITAISFYRVFFLRLT